jgi:cyclopropane-fatty-acyl-phospholipid synthase
MSSSSAATRSTVDSRPSLFEKLAREGLAAGLRRIREGTLVLNDAEETQKFESSHASELHAAIEIHDARFYRRVATGGGLAAAESYLDGDWSCPDLTSLFRLLIRNPQVTGEMDSGWAQLAGWIARAGHWLRRNTRAKSRDNIRAHYDLGNDFFRLFLDDTMMYSSGFFLRRESTLKEASIAKLDRICRRLDLRPNDHLLEIGTGWGGFALHAAREYGCRITTTTISREQCELARDRIRAAGLQERVTVLLEDYRDLSGTYDKLVSIEMIEAVGHRYYDRFFRVCNDRLASDGLMLLQGIVMNEQGYASYLRSVDFIQKYIFPGGCLPSVLALGQSAARASDMRILHIEDFAAHYACTLRMWRNRFLAAIDRVRVLGYSERFIRMWDYYLCYCEAAFEERSIGVVQMLWGKPRSRHASYLDCSSAPAGRHSEIAE